MQIGADTVKGTVKAAFSKIRMLGRKNSVPTPCDCEIFVSISAKQVRFSIPKKNTILTMRLDEVMNAVTAASRRFEQLRIKENFNEAMKEAENSITK